MRIILYAILFVIACTSGSKISPLCYPDQGIMEAVTTAVNAANKEEVLTQTITYDEFGKPILRKQDKREIVYNYDGDKFTSNIISNYTDIGDEMERRNFMLSSDTNYVIKNDQFGRALVMRGADGGRIEFTYDECSKEIQNYFNEVGDEVYEYILHYTNGTLTKTVWLTPGNSEGRETQYFGYKFDSEENWIEREYEHSSGERIVEKRTLEYY